MRLGMGQERAEARARNQEARRKAVIRFISLIRFIRFIRLTYASAM